MTFKKIVTKYGELTTPSEEKANETVKLIRAIVKDYVETNKLKSLVIGVSGGLDSACVAALCAQEYTGVPLIGISIPMSSTSAHIEQAEWVGNTYCTAFEEFNEWEEKYFDRNDIQNETFNSIPFYEKTFNILEQTNDLAAKAGFVVSEFPKAVLQGNMKARLRMITLYDLARKTNGMVLSTDNLSEFQMGFWTICGDVGDFGPIQNIGKGFELPAIARALGIREDIISQPPSDGLMVTEDNTDEAQLGANYREVDTIMGLYLGENTDLKTEMMNLVNTDKEGNEKVWKVINRYNALNYKRNGTVNLQRNQIGL